jgi:hypothetical protein
MDNSLLHGSVEPSFRERGHMGDQGFPPLQLSRLCPSIVMRLCNLFCNPLCAHNLEIRFLLGGGGAITSHSLNPCKRA